MSMTNFRAEDMPGNPGAGSVEKVEAEPAKTEKKAAAPKKTAAKKGVAPLGAPEQTDDSTKNAGVAEVGAPEQTNTETHGVGPSTIEGKDVSDETKDALAESVGGKGVLDPEAKDSDSKEDK